MRAMDFTAVFISLVFYSCVAICIDLVCFVFSSFKELKLCPQNEMIEMVWSLLEHLYGWLFPVYIYFF